MATFLGRPRYERTTDAAGSRNGHRPKLVQTAEGEITVAMPQVRGSLRRGARPGGHRASGASSAARLAVSVPAASARKGAPVAPPERLPIRPRSPPLVNAVLGFVTRT